MLPTTQEYKISLMIGQDSFRTLEDIKVVPNPNYPDEPWYSTGGLAIVFKIKMGEKLYALKCFYNEANERQERLGLIANYLKQNPAPYFVDFTYLDNEIFVETANGGEGYPVVLMEWVEGKTLDNYLEEVCQQQNKPALQNLYFQFCNLAWWLQQQPIAHGDLKHDNLMVTKDGELKMIDYDGMFVPALHGRKANEQGSPCYQHPKRDAHYFNERLDDFSLLILQITLLALQHDPSLFKAHYNGDGILLKDTDYPNFAQSSTKTLLWRLNDVKIPLLLSQLQTNLNNLSGIDLMPLLQDVEWINWLVAGQKDNKLILERQRLKKFILEDEVWASLFVTKIARDYPLSEKLIEEYNDIWDWKQLSRNSDLPWNFDLVDKYREKWDWDNLSCSIKMPWTIKLIEKYEDKWNFIYLSEKEKIPWTMSLIEKYEDKWGWKTLSYNSYLPWTLELIEKYKYKYDWKKLSSNSSLPWTIEFIEKYKHKWDWKELSSNKGLPWTFSLIEKFKNSWDWNSLSWMNYLPWTLRIIYEYEDKWSWEILSFDKKIPWTLSLIEKYENEWDWEKLMSNSGLPWSIELIEKYENKLDWKRLSSNSGLPWSIELIEKYQNKWDWESLSSNSGLPRTLESIEKFKNKWRWSYLSSNSGLLWTLSLIEKYENKWDWSNLSSNEKIPWTLSLIEKYKNRWHWKNLSYNYSLPWTMNLVEKYENEWDWNNLIVNSRIQWSITLVEQFAKYRKKTDIYGNSHWWRLEKLKFFSYEKVFRPILNDEFLIELLDEIIQMNYNKIEEEDEDDNDEEDDDTLYNEPSSHSFPSTPEFDPPTHKFD